MSHKFHLAIHRPSTPRVRSRIVPLSGTEYVVSYGGGGVRICGNIPAHDTQDRSQPLSKRKRGTEYPTAHRTCHLRQIALCSLEDKPLHCTSRGRAPIGADRVNKHPTKSVCCHKVFEGLQRQVTVRLESRDLQTQKAKKQKGAPTLQRVKPFNFLLRGPMILTEHSSHSCRITGTSRANARFPCV